MTGDRPPTAGNRRPTGADRVPPEHPAAGWTEAGYTRRRALADVLAVLRELTPYPLDTPGRRLSSVTGRRLLAALEHRRLLTTIEVPGAGPLDDVLLVFLFQIEADVDAPHASPASVLFIPTRLGSPGALHEAMLDTIAALMAVPAQDV